MSDWRKATGPAVGGIVAAAASALCCAGPILAVSVGISGASLASTFEPWRALVPGCDGTVHRPRFRPPGSGGKESLLAREALRRSTGAPQDADNSVGRYGSRRTPGDLPRWRRFVL